MLVATDAPSRAYNEGLWHGVYSVTCASSGTLANRLRSIQNNIGVPPTPLDAKSWLAAHYRPVPSAPEAAAMLFDRHRSAETTAARADAANLTRTTRAIQDTIDNAKSNHERVVVFATGIPGAGKTLCGLNVAFGGNHDPVPSFSREMHPWLPCFERIWAAGRERATRLGTLARRFRTFIVFWSIMSPFSLICRQRNM